MQDDHSGYNRGPLMTCTRLTGQGPHDRILHDRHDQTAERGCRRPQPCMLRWTASGLMARRLNVDGVSARKTPADLSTGAQLSSKALHTRLELSITDTSQAGGMARGAASVEHRPTSIAHVPFGLKDAIARSKARNPTLLILGTRS